MCGIIGVSGIPDAAQLTYLGLYALQHRGQESAGIVAIDREGQARAHRGMGLVSENFDESVLATLPGDVAVGHTRYSTTGSMVLASETCALDLLGAKITCELQPGEFVRIEDGQVTELPRLSPRPVSRCVFELVYFARPDSTVFGESVDRVRRELGRQLAREQPAPDTEVVFSVPDSSNAMALGYSEVSGIKLEHGLIRNHYVGRTFKIGRASCRERVEISVGAGSLKEKR